MPFPRVLLLISACTVGVCECWTLIPDPRRSIPMVIPGFKTARTLSSPLFVFEGDEGDVFGYAAEQYGEEYEEEEEEEDIEMGEWDERVARFNSVHLTGRIGNTPEPRYFDDGKVVVNVSLATKRKYHGMERRAINLQSGEEETDWYGLEIWGQKAEFVSKYVDKGARVGVIGQLKLDEWTDRETGEPRNRPKIIVREFDILETRAEADLRRNRNDDGDEYRGAGDGGFFD